MTEQALDCVFRNAKVIDGTGSPWYYADVGIKDGKIARLGSLAGVEAKETIDAAGLTVAPGFFDAHTHSDFSLILNPFPKSQLLQGVTSEVEGQCGYSAFPLVDSNRGLLFEPKGMQIDWATPEEYLKTLTRSGPAVNTAFLVGHTNVRAAVAGREDRKVTPDELSRMAAHVREAMEAGCIGMSTGLDYPPGGSADTEELVALCKVVAEFGGIYVSHVRGYTGNFANAVAEAIEIGRRAGVAVQIAHFGAAGTQGRELTRRALKLVDQAREEGIDVMIDVIPYGTGGAWWAPRAIFPEWAYDWRTDNLGHVRDLLMAPDTRARLTEEVEARRVMEKHGFEQEMIMFSDWGRIFLAEVAPGSTNAGLLNRNFLEIAQAVGKSPADAYFDLLIEEYPVFSTVRIATDADVMAEMLQRPYTMISSDSVATSPERAQESFNVLQAHPRNYGCLPHWLGDLARDQGIVSWEEAIRKVTSMPAQRFGFGDRGLVREGMAADLVVFDPQTLRPGSTWRQPRLLPKGIQHVLVNGQFAVRDGNATGICAGQVVRSGR
jgi:N-acyl-D-amino-acid deacylase